MAVTYNADNWPTQAAAPVVEGITDTVQGGTDETPTPSDGQYVPETTGPVNTLSGDAIPNIQSS